MTFWLFPKINSVLKEQRFQDTEDNNNKKNVTAMKAIPQKRFQKCFQQ
jgi:hypothetical protein